MRIRLDRFRLLPWLVLLLLLFLCLANFRAWTAFFASGSPDALPGSDPSSAWFSDFSAEIRKGDFLGRLSPANIPFFQMEPNEREQTMSCHLRYHCLARSAVPLLCRWYYGNTVFFTDSLRLLPADSLGISVFRIGRNHPGIWSVDILSEDGK